MGQFKLSSLNFGIEITSNNRSIDFKTSGGGPERQATLRLGLYNITRLLPEVSRAMREADPAFTYTVTIDRSIGGGTQNRLTVATSGGFLSLLFATGTRAGSSAGSLLGFSGDQTGGTSYTGTATVGTLLIPTYPPQDLQPLGTIHDAKRSLNETTSGVVETISFATFRNFEFKYKWILEGSGEFTSFQAFNIWVLRGGPIEFIEDIGATSTVSSGIPINVRPPLEINRMVPAMYDYFETPKYTFREQT